MKFLSMFVIAMMAFPLMYVFSPCVVAWGFKKLRRIIHWSLTWDQSAFSP